MRVCVSRVWGGGGRFGCVGARGIGVWVTLRGVGKGPDDIGLGDLEGVGSGFLGAVQSDPGV